MCRVVVYGEAIPGETEILAGVSTTERDNGGAGFRLVSVSATRRFAVSERSRDTGLRINLVAI